MLDLIYCAGGNRRLSQIAWEEGWQLGKRSDASSLDLPQVFIDIRYKNPNWERHLDAVKTHKPRYATITDLSDKEVLDSDIKRALVQHDQLVEYCEVPLIIPKLSGQLALLPSNIAIGYSVPTSYGGALYPLWEPGLAGRRIHLLGGSPKMQMEAFRYLSASGVVTSLDCNYAQKIAVKWGEYWTGKKGKEWVKHPGVKTKKRDIYYECWKWSCQNLWEEWNRITKINTSYAKLHAPKHN